MPKADEMVLVVPIEKLFGEKGERKFLDFQPAAKANFEIIIQANGIFMRHADVCGRPELKEPIMYCAVVDRNHKTVLVYQRAADDQAYGEDRLQGKISIGLGGHIIQADTIIGSTIRLSAYRELAEEIGLTSFRLYILGYLNFEGDKVSLDHFGIVAVVEPDQVDFGPKDPEVAWAKMMTIPEIEVLFADPKYQVEGWSRVILEPIKAYLA